MRCKEAASPVAATIGAAVLPSNTPRYRRLLQPRTFSILIGRRAPDSDFSCAIHEGKSRSFGDVGLARVGHSTMNCGKFKRQW
jgi:hypothetical protein